MKRLLFLALAMGVHSGAPAFAQRLDSTGVGAEYLPKNIRPPSGDTVSHDELLARREAAAKRGFKPKPQSEAAKDRKPVPAGSSYDLLEMSTLIQGNGVFTLVPKGSVIHLPPKFSERIVSKPTGRFMLWGEFLVNNRAWVQTHEVDVERARGLKSFDPETLLNFGRKGNLVVATYCGHPISVNPPPGEASATVAAGVASPKIPH
jgi:hypothetical protein